MGVPAFCGLLLSEVRVGFGRQWIRVAEVLSCDTGRGCIQGDCILASRGCFLGPAGLLNLADQIGSSRKTGEAVRAVRSRGLGLYDGPCGLLQVDGPALQARLTRISCTVCIQIVVLYS